MLLLNGVFICQIALDLWRTNHWCCCDQTCFQCVRRNQTRVNFTDYSDLDNSNGVAQGGSLKKVRLIIDFFETLLENRATKVIALALQFAGVSFFIVCWLIVMSEQNVGIRYIYKLRPMIGLPLSLLALSFIWSNKVQEWIAKPDNTLFNDGREKRTARYKSSTYTLCNYYITRTCHSPIKQEWYMYYH